ncbi:MAG: galactose-1-phosphate uridylyltransferase [Rhodothermales bacterium]|nr:galactose-1-phosphate uridylyltransferase [Rhodothermales bacterium]
MTDSSSWHQRWHPLRREWVVYSAHRNTRPWVGKREIDDARADLPSYEPNCYLCPSNTRASGETNPDYDGVFVFDNDHPVVSMGAPSIDPSVEGRQRRASGVSRVICYDPRHDLTLTEMPLGRVVEVFKTWKEQTSLLATIPDVKFVLVFENRGEITGTSAPHPHCQIYATNFVFKNIEIELESMRGDPTIFQSILTEEGDSSRVIAENEHAIAFVPFFARYPYEVWLFPKQRHPDLRTVPQDELVGLADVYLQLTKRYDGMFASSFPFVMSLYQAPVDGNDYDRYHLHFVFLPPLRRPGIQKFPAGPEIGGGNFMNDMLPEIAAEELRTVQITH